MLAKLFGWAWRAVVGVLAVLGLGALLLGWSLTSLLGSKPAAKIAPPAAQVEQVQTLVAEPAACLCSSGAECVGPRGGKYCMDEAGRKKYRGGDK